MNPSAPLGIPSEPPAVHGPLLGDDEAACLPSPVSKLTPLAASKHSVGALSPTDVALFPTPPCIAEGSLKEASRTPSTLFPGGYPGSPLRAFSARSAALY